MIPPFLRRRAVACIPAVALALAGCASILHGTDEIVSVSSMPSGAKVLVNGKETGTTPAYVRLPRDGDRTVMRVEKEGWQPYEVALNRKIDPWIIGNAVFWIGAPVGLLVDFLDGAAYQQAPSEIQAVLQK